MATPFEVDSGARQGRSPHALTEGGAQRFELGHGSALAVYLEPGDFSAVEQSYVVANQVALIRLDVRVVCPEVPPGMSWTFTARLNGVAHYTRTLTAGKTHRITDAALRMSAANAYPTPNTVQFRLALS